MMPSFTSRPIGFTPPDGYHASTPSVALLGGEIVLLQRAVNFTLSEDDGYRTPNDAPVHTRNFLLRLDAELAIRSSTEILPPADMPAPAFTEVQGFEDARLFAWRDELWCIARVRELTPEGWCDQVLARIDDREPGSCRLSDWRVLRPEGPRRHEKNWMPRVAGDQLQFIPSAIRPGCWTKMPAPRSRARRRSRPSSFTAAPRRLLSTAAGSRSSMR